MKNIEHIEGLETRISPGNNIKIDQEAKFSLSKIYIDGTGNEIDLGPSLIYERLFINIRGSNKKIIIKRTSKKIVGLKIVSIRGSGQSVVIDSDFSCGGCEMQINDGAEKVEIGSNCLFSWGIKIRASDGHTIFNVSDGSVINMPSNVFINNHVWICEDVKILKGAYIPSDCVVASGSIVTKVKKSFGEGSILAGVPAKVIRAGINWSHQNPIEYC